MDFIERLNEQINKTPSLPLTCRLGYLDTEESLVLYPLPGSRIVGEFMDGITDQQLNYEVAMKSKSQSKIHQSLWAIQNALELLTELESTDGSFEFTDLIMTNKPYINEADQQGWFVFLLTLQADVTVIENKEESSHG